MVIGNDVLAERHERDGIALLGMLAHLSANWDAPIHGTGDRIHTVGLNVCSLVVDNRDGELLSITTNRVEEGPNPLEHAEQRAIRAAIQRLNVKRVRQPGESMNQYCRSSLFYGRGSDAAAFVHEGCTLYVTLEPCPMCTATVCVARIKRVAFLFSDPLFGGSWDWQGDSAREGIKQRYYPWHQMEMGPLSHPPDTQAEVAGLYSRLMRAVGEEPGGPPGLLGSGVRAGLYLDHLKHLLDEAFAIFATRFGGPEQRSSATFDKNRVFARGLALALGLSQNSLLGAVKGGHGAHAAYNGGPERS